MEESALFDSPPAGMNESPVSLPKHIISCSNESPARLTLDWVNKEIMGLFQLLMMLSLGFVGEGINRNKAVCWRGNRWVCWGENGWERRGKHGWRTGNLPLSIERFSE